MDTRELRGLFEAYQQVHVSVDEAVKGQDTGERREASRERKRGDKRLSPSAGKANADKMERDIKFYDKVTKKTRPSVVGMTHEEVGKIDEEPTLGRIKSAMASQRSAQNAAGMRGSELTHGAKPAAKSSAGSAAIKPQPRSREFSHGGSGTPLKATLKGGLTMSYEPQGNQLEEDFDIFDIVLEFLQVEGYAETLEEAEWIMANELDAEDIDAILEAEGSYGQTPKARQAMGKLAIARREKPASEYSQKGEKTKKVKEIEKHTRRIDNGPDVGNRGKKSTKPRYSGMLGKSVTVRRPGGSASTNQFTLAHSRFFSGRLVNESIKKSGFQKVFNSRITKALGVPSNIKKVQYSFSPSTVEASQHAHA